MADFIELKRGDNTAIFVGELLTLVGQGRSFFDTLEKVRDKAFRMKTDGPPLDLSQFATLYGIPVASAQAVFDRINGIYLALTGAQQNAQFVELIDAVG